MKQSATLDTSFWINAHRAGLLSYVLADFDLHCSSIVAEELSEAFEAGRQFWRLVRSGEVRIEEPRLDVVAMFGPGEQSAMNLALEHSDWFLLMDDRRPLQAAQDLGIRAVCTPALVITMLEEGRIQLAEATRYLSRLTSIGTVSPSLIAPAAALLASADDEGGHH